MTNIFCEIALTSGTRYLSLKDVYYSPVRITEDDEERILESGETRVVEETYAYRGDMVDEVNIQQSLPDVWYGVEETSGLTLVLADNRMDSWYDIIDAEEIRGCAVVLYDGEREFIAAGKITGYVLGDDVRLTVELRNDEIFDASVPAGVVTGALFDASAVNVGAPINIVFGYAKNVPLPNICNDVVNDYYDYLIGYGPVESLWVDHTNGYGVKRDGVLVDTAEYTFYDGSQASPYNGYAFIRFTVEQKDFGGNFHNLSADVKGLELGGASADRNFANCIKALINNSTYGLNQSVNAASFTAAATTLADWKCDYVVYRQQAARDILDDMLFAARSRIYMNADGEWVISVDGTASSSASFGENDGYYNNCIIESVSAADAKNAIKTARVRYDDDRYQISLDVRTGFGVEKIYSVPCTTDLTTAKKILSYIYGRAYYADRTLVMLADSDASDLSPGNVITITSARHNLSAATYRVISITKALTQYRVECEAYNASIFADQTISDPTAQTGTYATHPLQTIDSGTVGGATVDDTTIANSTNIILDFDNKKICINSATFGNQGIQLDYNGGTPRLYVGNGGTKFLKFDGTDISGNYSGVVNMAAQGGCKVERSTTQTIPYDTVTTIQYNSEVWDTRNEYNSSTYKYTLENDSKIIITAQAISDWLAWWGGDEWDVFIYVNGAKVGGSGSCCQANSSGMFQQAMITTELDLDANDYIEIKIYQSYSYSGGTSVDILTANNSTFLTIQKVA